MFYLFMGIIILLIFIFSIFVVSRKEEDISQKQNEEYFLNDKGVKK